MQLDWRKLGCVLVLLSGATAFGMYANTVTWSLPLVAAKIGVLAVFLLGGFAGRLIDVSWASRLVRAEAESARTAPGKNGREIQP